MILTLVLKMMEMLLIALALVLTALRVAVPEKKNHVGKIPKRRTPSPPVWKRPVIKKSIVYFSGPDTYASRTFATRFFVAHATPLFVTSATPFFRSFQTFFYI